LATGAERYCFHVWLLSGLAGFSIPLALLRAASSSRKRGKNEGSNIIPPFSTRSGGAKQESANADDEP
jgi:hypothetical protein